MHRGAWKMPSQKLASKGGALLFRLNYGLKLLQMAT